MDLLAPTPTTPEINLEGLRPWAGLAISDRVQADVVVAGIPYDGAAVYRRGAAQAPRRVRALSAAMSTITETGRSLGELRIADIGDLQVGDSIETGWGSAAAVLRNVPPGALLTVIGGDHSSAIPVLAAQVARHPDLAVLWLDSHPDLCDFSRGGRWTCGCALRRGLEVAHLSPASVVIAGGRDYDQEELDYIAAEGIRLLSTREVAADPESAGQVVAEKIGARPLHVSIDVDVLDPACAPGTELPVAGGLTTREVLTLLSTLVQRTRLVGLDLMEICPPSDHNDITTMAALKLIFEVWGYARWSFG